MFHELLSKVKNKKKERIIGDVDEMHKNIDEIPFGISLRKMDFAISFIDSELGLRKRLSQNAE